MAESTSESPDKKYFPLNLKEIASTAQSLGSIAKPVLETVENSVDYYFEITYSLN